MKILPRLLRQLRGEMASKKEDENQKWREKDVDNMTLVKKANGDTESSEGRLTSDDRLKPMRLQEDVKPELQNDLSCAGESDSVPKLLLSLSNLNINSDESGEKNESQGPLNFAQDRRDSSSGVTLQLKNSSKINTQQQTTSKLTNPRETSSQETAPQDKIVSALDALKISDARVDINGETGEEKSESLEKSHAAYGIRGSQEKVSNASSKSETTREPEESTVPSKGTPCRTQSERVELDNSNLHKTKDEEHNCNLECKAVCNKDEQSFKHHERQTSKKDDKNTDFDTRVKESKAEHKPITDDDITNETVKKLVLKLRMCVQQEGGKAPPPRYRARAPQPLPSSPAVGDANDSELLTSTMPNMAHDCVFLPCPEVTEFLPSSEVSEFLECLESLLPPLQQYSPEVYADPMMVSFTASGSDSDRDDCSSAPDSGMDSPRPGECDTPPYQHCVNKVLKDRLRTPVYRGGGASPPMDSPSSYSSSMASPMSLRDSPQPACVMGALSPAGSPPPEQTDLAHINSLVYLTTFEEHEHHKYMRSRCVRKPHPQGYSTTGPPDHVPVLLGFLKDAAHGTPDYTRIYESARCYLSVHIALLYEEDAEQKTALYYAARLNKDDRIVGFIVECLLEAQHKCSLIGDAARYRMEIERYGKSDDNILHCLARWHSVSNNYIPVAQTLLKTCCTLQYPEIERLKIVPNNEGKLPHELCVASDMREFLYPGW